MKENHTDHVKTPSQQNRSDITSQLTAYIHRRVPGMLGPSLPSSAFLELFVLLILALVIPRDYTIESKSTLKSYIQELKEYTASR